MKKKLVTMLCCVLVVSNLAACGKEQVDNEASQETGNQVTVESNTSDESRESELTSEEVVESATSETTESQPNNETVVESTPEETIYSVELTAIGEDKVSVINIYRTLTGLGLKEAKDIVDSAPCVVLETTNLEEAELYKTSLEECGATITILDGTADSPSQEAESSTAVDVTESTESTETAVSETTGAKFAVDSVFSITGAGTVLTGKVEQGSIKLGDSAVIVLEDGTEIPVTINRIEVFGDLLEVTEEGKNVSLGFEEEITKDSVLTAVSVVVAAE